MQKDPWNVLLLPAARAAWRASELLPPQQLAKAQFELIEESQRSPKQLKRSFHRTLVTLQALAARRDRERQRARNPQDQARPGSLAHKADIRKDADASPMYYGPEQTVASLRHRLLPNYAVARRVFMEVRSLLGHTDWKPQRVIDFGIGCGSASAAALDVFDSIEWIHGVDPSQSMRNCAERILDDVTEERDIRPRVTVSEMLTKEAQGTGFDLAIMAYTANEMLHAASTLAAAAVLWEKLRPNGLLVLIEPGTPDGFSSVRSVRSMLLDCCPPDDDEPGMSQCHIIAPCTHNGTCPMEGYRRKPKTRRKLSRTADAEDGRVEVLDDESHELWDESSDDEEDSSSEEETGDGDSDEENGVHESEPFQKAFCSFVHTIPGKAKAKGEKLSFLVAQKRYVESPSAERPSESSRHNGSLPLHDVDLVELLSQTHRVGLGKPVRKAKRQPASVVQHEELLETARKLQARYEESKEPLKLDFLQNDRNRASFGRIVRAPLKRRGHVLIDYCAGPKDEEIQDGRIVRCRVSKAIGARVSPGLFAAARKSRWGGYWPDANTTNAPDEIIN